MDETPPLQLRPPTDVDAKVAAMQEAITSLHRLLIETDKRYEQRFLGQEKAVVAALAAAEKAVTAALAAAEKAVMVAEQNSEKWRANANEWRGAMDDRERKYVMKENMEPMFQAMQKEINTLQAEATELRTLLAAVRAMQVQVNALITAEATRVGQSQGVGQAWTLAQQIWPMLMAAATAAGLTVVITKVAGH